jgi:hypothetical protein
MGNVGAAPGVPATNLQDRRALLHFPPIRILYLPPIRILYLACCAVVSNLDFV